MTGSHYHYSNNGNAGNFIQFIEAHYERFITLSKSECTILKMLAEGLKPATISSETNLELNQIQYSIGEIQKKLPIKKRNDYIKFALAFGLIPF